VDQEVLWLLTEKLLRVRTGPVFANEDVIIRRSRVMAAFCSTVVALVCAPLRAYRIPMPGSIP
jgi:hypothetical protein